MKKRRTQWANQQGPVPGELLGPVIVSSWRRLSAMCRVRKPSGIAGGALGTITAWLYHSRKTCLLRKNQLLVIITARHGGAQ